TEMTQFSLFGFFIKAWMLSRSLKNHNARLWGGLGAAKRRERPSQPRRGDNSRLLCDLKARLGTG
ncbi:hypothetical protein, partial [Marinospirillum minutulum]|uniref:hypothetical protein n=1 Tax=Marinospirillum minutulum TaxID=64974 RepID=UPI001B7F8756